MERIPADAAMASMTTNITLPIAVRPGVALRLIQSIGISGASVLAGMTFAQSWTATPALMLAPAPLLARQWLRMFQASKLIPPPVVLASLGAFSYLAYGRGPGWDVSRYLYTAGAGVLLAVIPYSYAFLEPLNQELERKNEELAAMTGSGVASKTQEENVHALVDRWALVNAGRSLLCAIAASCGLWAVLDQTVEVV